VISMPNRHLERSGYRTYSTAGEADLLSDALGVAGVINTGGVEVVVIAVAVTMCAEGGVGQPGRGRHLEVATVDGGGLGLCLDVLVLAVAGTTCVEGGVGQLGWGWHLEFARFPEPDAVGLKGGGGERKRKCDNRFLASNLEVRERGENGVCLRDTRRVRARIAPAARLARFC